MRAPSTAPRRPPSHDRRRASVLVIVLVTLLFTAAALTLFIDRAATEIIVQARQVRADDLRVRAHSALQATLSVLNEYMQVDGRLHDPSQGWGNALALAGWDEERDGRVTLEFIDESGRFPINQATRDPLIEFFKVLGIQDRDAESLADNLLEWRGANTEGNPFGASQFDYTRQPIPYTEPKRRLGTFSELLLIRDFPKFFADDAGQPNARFQQLVQSASLQEFTEVNVNTAGDEVLKSWLGLSDIQTARLRDEQKRQRRPGELSYMKDTADLGRILGTTNFQQAAGTAIEALRITVKVQDGSGTFPLSVVLRTSGGGGGGNGGGNQRITQDGGNNGQQGNNQGGNRGNNGGQTRPPGVPAPPTNLPPGAGGGNAGGNRGGTGAGTTTSISTGNDNNERQGRSGGSNNGRAVEGTGFRIVELSEGGG